MAEWSKMCRKRIDEGINENLEAMIKVDPQCYTARICRGIILWIREDFEHALAELEQAIPLVQEPWGAYFWKGMVNASFKRNEDAVTALEKALEVDLPPVLLAPLRWLEQDRQDFYERYVVQLLARYD